MELPFVNGGVGSLKVFVAVFFLICCSSVDLAAYALSYEPEGGSSPQKAVRCQPLTLPMCKSLGFYNQTRMPNFFSQETQAEAGLEANQFWPLVKINCAPMLGFFLCSLYVPVCLENYDKPLPPCRSVCLSSKSGCEPIMDTYGFKWPEKLNCDQFPASSKERLCMEPPPNKTPPARKKSKTREENQRLIEQMHKQDTGGIWETNVNDLNDVESGIPYKPVNPPTFTISGCPCICGNGFVPVSRQYHPRGPMKAGNVTDCTYSCHTPFFSKPEQDFAVFWIGLWSVLCCASTLITVSTFLIDMNRFRYPERSIIFMSFCYLMMSFGFIIRLIVGHEDTACNTKNGIDAIKAGTPNSAVCTIVFILTYFFGMASSVWWVILSLTWFMAAGLKWSTEAISGYAQYFHLAAWLMPTFKTVAILAISAADGDPVSGICYVGNTDLDALKGFVLAPLFLYLLLGSLFLFAGFVSLFRIRHHVKQEGKNRIEKLEQLMVRIGIFSVLYTVPATIVIACYFYEDLYRLSWEQQKTCPSCASIQQHYKPQHAIFMLKYLMLYVVGVTSGMWIWSRKTLESWRKFGRKLCSCCYATEEPIYQRTEAIIAVRSATDVSSAYNKQYPLNHV